MTTPGENRLRYFFFFLAAFFFAIETTSLRQMSAVG
jgi:hypothetical protein